MIKHILVVMLMGMALSGCVSGTKTTDSYVGRDGKTTVIESDRESCTRSCNNEYSRCMDTRAAGDNSGVIGRSGYVGASGDCRKSLKDCLPGCKSE